jgi:hypothetical protein
MKKSPRELLQAAIKAGLTAGEALEAFHEPHPAIDKARDMYQNDDVQVDYNALTSEAALGTWVQAWVWVPIDDPA